MVGFAWEVGCSWNPSPTRLLWRPIVLAETELGTSISFQLHLSWSKHPRTLQRRRWDAMPFHDGTVVPVLLSSCGATHHAPDSSFRCCVVSPSSVLHTLTQMWMHTPTLVQHMSTHTSSLLQKDIHVHPDTSPCPPTHAPPIICRLTWLLSCCQCQWSFYLVTGVSGIPVRSSLTVLALFFAFLMWIPRHKYVFKSFSRT